MMKVNYCETQDLLDWMLVKQQHYRDVRRDEMVAFRDFAAEQVPEIVDTLQKGIDLEDDIFLATEYRLLSK